MAAALPAKGRGQTERKDTGEVGGRSFADWSTFKQRGREILSRARDREHCVRRMKARALAFINSSLNRMDFKGGVEGMDPAVSVGGIRPLNPPQELKRRGVKVRYLCRFLGD